MARGAGKRLFDFRTASRSSTFGNAPCRTSQPPRSDRAQEFTEDNLKLVLSSTAKIVFPEDEAAEFNSFMRRIG